LETYARRWLTLTGEGGQQKCGKSRPTDIGSGKGTDEVVFIRTLRRGNLRGGRNGRRGNPNGGEKWGVFAREPEIFVKKRYSAEGKMGKPRRGAKWSGIIG